MTLCDELLFVASILRDGDAGPHTQIVASHRLERIADDVHRMQQMLDGIVADSQSEEHLLAVSERRSQVRLPPAFVGEAQLAVSQRRSASIQAPGGATATHLRLVR